MTRTDPPIEVVQNANPEFSARADGITAAVYEAACKANCDLLFCFDMALKRASPQCVSVDKCDIAPQYFLRIYSPTPVPMLCLGTGQDVPDGIRYDTDSTADFPFANRQILLRERNSDTSHTEIVFAVRELNSSEPLGVAWITFKNLRYIGWWERYFVRDLANFVAGCLQGNLLRLAARNFKHMIPQVVNSVQNDIETVLYRNGRLRHKAASHHKIHGDRISAPTWQGTLRKSIDALYLIHCKAEEVKGLLQRASKNGSPDIYELKLVIRRAWAIANRLRITSNRFKPGRSGNRAADRCHDFSAVYDNSEDRTLRPPAYLFSMIVNVLSNAVKYGNAPFGVWIGREEGILRITCCNGGKCPDQRELWRFSVTKQGSDDPGVGIPTLDYLVRLSGGAWRCFDSDVARDEYPGLPFDFTGCKTFFEIRLPQLERELHDEPSVLL